MYTLAIEDTVEVPVKFTLKEGRVNKLFSFTLVAKRLPAEEIAEAFKAAEFNFKGFFEATGVVSDWQGQRLVLDAKGDPAEFTPEAFSCMLGVSGVAQAVYQAYAKEAGAKEKN